jgi:hypothetical protein
MVSMQRTQRSENILNENTEVLSWIYICSIIAGEVEDSFSSSFDLSTQ